MKSKLHLIREAFPHYSRSENDFPVRYYYAFSDAPGQEDYARMLDGISAAAENKKWFPLARLSHGEFHLCVGRPWPHGVFPKVKHICKTILRELGLMPMIDHQGKTNDGKSREKLTRREFYAIKAQWTEAMRDIGREGMIAPAFNDRHSYVEPIDGMFRFFQRNDILFSESNFTPMFGVYAFLCGPDFEALVQGKHVAAVTWFDEEREAGLRSTFQNLGATSFTPVPVSPHNAALETVHPDKLEHVPDIVLFACGLGSVTLMYQFKGTKAICIDAGFALDVLANQELRGKRAWTLPDHLYEEFQGGDR